MSQLAHLRQKIKSIQTTKKVTHAIRLVSMSLYGKLEKQDTHLRYYTEKIKHFFLEHLQQASSWSHPLLMPDASLAPKRLYIIVGTSRGLCGSLNTNLFRFVQESLADVVQHENDAFITIGTKAYKFVKETLHRDVLYSYQELNSNNFITVADALVEKIMYSQAFYTNVTFIATRRRSFFIQMPLSQHVIPFSSSSARVYSDDKQEELGRPCVHNSNVIWEQPNEHILNVLALGYVRSSVIDILFQALLAEYASRFLAMDSSTTNAEKYLERLTLQYNKARQAAITKEVSELSSGFMEGV